MIRARFLTMVFPFLLCSAAEAASPKIAFADGVLTLTTDRYEVTWRDGCMAGLKTRVPKEAALTVEGTPMAVDALPNGLGSLHGQVEAARAQHHPWSFRKPGEAFPAQHSPFAKSMVRCTPIEGGARLYYAVLKGDPKGVLLQELTVDPKTGDLVIRQQGRTTDPGLFGIGFSVLNLRPDVELAVPYFGGQRWGRAFTEGRLISIGWPQFWSAGLVVGTAPDAGAFAVWAEDPRMRPKYFHCLHTGKALGLGFQANEEAPYEKRTETKAFTWRFNVFDRWQQAAGRYKRGMADAYSLVPRRKREPAWASKIAMVWPANPSQAELEAMASLIDPKQVLIQRWGWLKGFNRRLPEYLPQDKGFAKSVWAARKMGYHVSAYTSMALLDQESFPTMMAAYGLKYQYHAPWKPYEKKTDWLVYVHPGSGRWRAFYAEKMADVTRNYGLDALYQDVSGCGTGSSGLIERRNFHQAVVACEDVLRERLPNVAIAGEFWNEVNICREDFGLQNFLKWDPGAKWDGATHREVISRPMQPHPICSHLFSDYCVYWPHQVPIRDTEMFHQDQNINEVIGGVAVWTTTVDDRMGEARVMLERAGLWAAGFRPSFPDKWDTDAVSYMRTPDGRTLKYARRGESSYCIETSGGSERLRYARVRGVSEVKLKGSSRIDGWIAYGENGPVGLDPTKWYCVFRGGPPRLPITLVRVPDGGWVQGTRLTDQFWMVALGGKGEGTAIWQTAKPFLWMTDGTKPQPPTKRDLRIKLPCTLVFAVAEPTSHWPGAPLALEAWQHHIVSQGNVVKAAKPKRRGTFPIAGTPRKGLMIMPPLGGKGSEYSIDALVKIPPSDKAALIASVGLLGASGDGVHIVVRANGREIWRRHRETKPGWEDIRVPLADHGGQTVVLSLAVDCGPGGFNLSCDEVVWADARIVVQAN